MTAPRKLRRSLLLVTPMMPQMLEASRTTAADVLCLDLEDGVPPDQKENARSRIRDFLDQARPQAIEVLVRVNALGSPWAPEDLRFAGELDIDGVLLPKAEGDGVFRQARDVLGPGKPIWCLVETALGVLRAEQLAAAGAEAFVVGGADLSESLRVRNVLARTPLLHSLGHILLVARAYGISAIDALHHDYFDMGAIEEATGQSAVLGFDGKMVFDPKTTALANRIFAPTAEDCARAAKLLEQPTAYGAHLQHARRIIEFAQLAVDRDAALQPQT